MRSFLLAFFVGLALAHIDEEAFSKNRHYVFRYEAQLITGSPSSSELWSGIKLTCNLHLYFLTNDKVAAKMSNVVLQKMDKYVEQRTPTFFMQPGETMLDGVEAELQKHMISQLQKVFYFKWHNGYVKEVQIDLKEPLWCTNLKKGVVNLFQVNLNQIFSLTPVPPTSDVSFNPYQPPYVVWEETIFGNCKTTYTPQPTESPLPNTFYLTKVRDYQSCLKKPYSEFSFNNFMPEAQNVTSHLDYQGQVTYAIKGDKSGFLIMTAMGEGKIVFTPYSPQGGNVQTSINQTLWLVNGMDIAPEDRHIFDFPKDVQKGSLLEELEGMCLEQELQMGLPMEHIHNMSPYDYDKPYVPLDKQNPIWYEDKMNQVLEWAANGTNSYPSEDVIVMMQNLIEMVRQSRPDTLNNILQKVRRECNDPSSVNCPTKLKLYWDLLINAGTTSASTVALDYCLGDRADRAVDTPLISFDDPKIYSRCVDAASSIGLYSPPSKDVIFKLLSLAIKGFGHPTLNSLKMTSTLALGSVLGRAQDKAMEIKNRWAKYDQTVQTIVFLNSAQSEKRRLLKCKRYWANKLDDFSNQHHQIVGNVSKFFERTLQSSFESDIILSLQSLRNAHCQQVIPSVTQWLFNTTASTSVRLIAAQALETFVHQKNEVCLILERVVKNPFEKPAVRIQAFRSLVNIGCPESILVRIADSIRYEKEKQVSTFVWTSFNNLANSTFPPYKTSSDKMRSSLPFIQPKSWGWQDSHFRTYQVSCTDNVHFLSEMSNINTRDGVLNLDYAGYLSIFGTHNKFFQVSYTSEGVMQLLKQMIGPQGFLTKKNSVLDLFSRPKRSASPDDKIRQIVEKLQIELREFPKMKTFFSVQRMNRVWRSWDFSDIMTTILDLKLIKTDIDEDKLKAGVTFNYNTAGLFDQFFMELPTEVGFPVTFQTGFNYAAKITGQMAAGVEPSLYKDERGFVPPTKLRASIYLAPKFVGSWWGKMAIDGYIYQAGSVLYAHKEINAPFSINTTLNLHDSRFTVKFSPPDSQSLPIAKVELKPYVYSRSLCPQLNTTVQAGINQRPIFQTLQPIMISNGAKSHQTKYTLGENWLGYQLSVQGQRPWRPIPSITPALPLSGRATYNLYIRPVANHSPVLSADVKFVTQSQMDKQSKMSQDVPLETEPIDITEQYVDLKDIPDLSKPIQFRDIKKKIEERVGYGIPSAPAYPQWGFVAVFNASCPIFKREGSMVGVFMSEAYSQYKQAYISLHRSPISEYDTNKWQMTLQATSMYPTKKFTIWHLVDPRYQANVAHDMYNMLKNRDHKQVDRYFQQLVFTIVENNAQKMLPSVDPQSMLDRIVPERILKCADPFVVQLKMVLKDVLPVADELLELRSECKDALKITEKQLLIQEICKKVYGQQMQLSAVLSELRSEIAHPPVKSLTAQYTIMKLTQSVLVLKDIVERAINLSLVDNADFLAVQKDRIIAQQSNIYMLAREALIPRTLLMQKMSDDLPLPVHRQTRSVWGLSKVPFFGQNPYDYGSYYDSSSAYNPRQQKQNDAFADTHQGEQAYKQADPSKADTSVHDTIDTISTGNPDSSVQDAMQTVYSVSALTEDLEKLNRQQLYAMWQVWLALAQNSSVSVEPIVNLLQATSGNISNINNIIKATDFKDQTVADFIYFITVQHQTLAEMFEKVMMENSGPVQPSFCRYSTKAQTRQLLEKAIFMEHALKMNMTCGAALSPSEVPLMKMLEKVDRVLQSIEHDVFDMPSKDYPWSADFFDLKWASKDMARAKEDLNFVRDSIVRLDVKPHPCMVGKLVHTVANVRKTIAVCSKALPSLPRPDAQLMQDLSTLKDWVSDYANSLDVVFHAYFNDTFYEPPTMFPAGQIIIPEDIQEVSSIHATESRILDQLHKYLYQFANPPVEVIKNIIQTTTDQSQKILESLEKLVDRLQYTMQNGSPVTSYRLYSSYVDSLQQLQDIVDILKQQITINAKQPSLPDIQEDLNEMEMRLGDLLKKVQLMELPKAYEPYSQSQLPHYDVSHPQGDVTKSAPPSPNPSQGDFYGGIPDPQIYGYYGGDQSMYPQPVSQTLKKTDLLSSAEMKSLQSKLRLPYSGNEILFNVNITYGNPTVPKATKTIGIQVHARKSVTQMIWEGSQYYPPIRDHCVARAIQLEIAGRRKLDTCGYEINKRLNTYQHVHVAVTVGHETYTNSGPSTKLPSEPSQFVTTVMDKMMTMMTHSYYDRSILFSVNDNSTFPATQFVNMHAICDFSGTMDSMDMYYHMPNKAMFIQSLPLPVSVLKAWYPFQNHAPLIKNVEMVLTDKHMPATCKVSRNNVMTNDQAIYSLPTYPNKELTQCSTVLAMDCSPDLTFALTLHPVPSTRSNALQILAEKHEVVLTPDFMNVQAIIDGQRKPLQYGQPIYIYKEIAYGKHEVAITLTKQKDGSVRCQYPLVGLDILFDTNDIAVDMSNVYKQQLCGLCGNFDGQMTDELEGPQRKISQDVDTFFLKYTIPDDQCPINELRQKIINAGSPVKQSSRPITSPRLG